MSFKGHLIVHVLAPTLLFSNNKYISRKSMQLPQAAFLYIDVINTTLHESISLVVVPDMYVHNKSSLEHIPCVLCSADS